MDYSISTRCSSERVVFNGGNIRFKGAYFYWIFAERIGKLILGYWGTSLLVLGLLTKIKTKPLFLYSFIISSLIYLVSHC